ncbi:MAG: hypothetical protein Ta2F_13300 [Termitinemataceae bacterium]|nr:MAG: hypothetical protein Ta2F_13300 [Termitinemataceae bacterium]
MLKKISFFILPAAAVVVSMLISCATKPIPVVTVDPTVAQTDTAVVYFYSTDHYLGNRKANTARKAPFMPKTLDGKALPKGYREGNGLRVPSGEHTFLTKLHQWYSGISKVVSDTDGTTIHYYFSAKNIQFKYNFKDGASYYVDTILIGGEGAKLKIPMLIGGFTGPKRSGGDPIIAVVNIYEVTEYDSKYQLPIITEDTPYETIHFDTEVSF